MSNHKEVTVCSHRTIFIVTMADTSWVTGEAEIIFVILGALATAAVSFYLGKKKSGREDFNTLITANEQFRTEIRKDLIEAKQKVASLESTILEKENELKLLVTDNNTLRNEIIEKERRLSEMRIDLLRKDIFISQLEGKLKILEKK